MMGRKLAIACFAAIAALAMTACSGGDGDAPDAGNDGADVVTPKDGGGNTPTCKPACGKDETCNIKAIPPRCEKLCNPPEGCSDLEVCDTSGAKPECKPVKCGNNQCERGQGCFNPLTGAPGGNTCTCLPDSNITSDTCAEFGMKCDYDWDNGGASKCLKPGDWEPCVEATGCQEGLECTDLDGEFYCLRPCTKTTDCPDVSQYCVPNDPQLQVSPALRNKCMDNICSWGGYPIQDATPAQERAKYYQPCDAAGTGDGSCLPHWLWDGRALYDVGYCYQAGTAPSLGKCDPKATRLTAGANNVGLCPKNELCSGGTPDQQSPSKMSGLCRPLCNAGPQAEPVRGCGAGEICLDTTGLDGEDPAKPEYNWLPAARLGICETACQMYGNGACPDDALGNKQGCIYTYRLDENGYCTALRPNAGGWGEACAPKTANDGRMRCGDRMMCVTEKGTDGNYSEFCRSFCNHEACGDATKSCSVCDSRACEACTPDCGGKVCGVDANGCSCGTCGAGKVCSASGQCEDCGSDDCGGTCGTCGAGKVCNAGKCIDGTAPKCVPDCAHKTCGPDGCGGTCGNACDAGHKCATKGGDLKCNAFSDAPPSAMVGYCGKP